MTDWQPIETAPKDGTFVLAAEESGYIHIVQWYGKQGFWRTDCYSSIEWQPIHWQPLPNPPNTEAQPGPATSKRGDVAG